MSKILTALDLFSGCGGLSQGLKDAGFKVLGAIEIDSKASETFNLNHPEVPIVGKDIREVNAAELLGKIGLKCGELDLLAGCPPCQGFSSIRRRNKKNAVDDSRNDLIDDFSRIAFGLLPKLIMMENVPGLATYEKFLAFVKLLKNSGYEVVYKVLDVSQFGVPQRRKRLILSASRIGDPNLASPDSRRIFVREAIGALAPAGSSGDSLHDFLSTKRSERVQKLIAAIPKNGGSRSSLPPYMQLNCHKNNSGFNDVYGRIKWDDVSPTITGGCTNPSKGRFLHPEYDRAITLREAALLQGFPSDYKFNISHGRQAISLMIGNALPPPFIAAHTKLMAKGLVDAEN